MEFLDQRQKDRKPARWPGRLITSDKQTFKIKSKNISTAGAQLDVSGRVKQGDTVLIEIHALYQNIKQSIRAQAKVNYVLVSGSDLQIGVSFLTITDEDIKFIELYCKTKRIF